MRVLLAGLLLTVAALAEEPLPLNRSAKLQGKTFTLTGRHALGKGVRITLGPGTRVVGRGKNAVIDLEGSIQVAGEPGAEVVFENVWINLTWKFAGLRIKHAKFLKSGGVSVPHERETRGKAYLEHVTMTKEASVWVTFHEGSIELRHVTSESTCQIAATASDRNVKLDMFACRFTSSSDPKVIKGGLRTHHVKEVRIENTHFGGLSSSFTGGVKLALEGCRFAGRGVSFRQPTKGRIGKIKIAKCDFGKDTGVTFEGPRGGKERVTLKECYFGGIADPKTILGRIVAKDCRVAVKAPRPKPNDLAK